jgi:Natural resistance-associated macrophage protein-like
MVHPYMRNVTVNVPPSKPVGFFRSLGPGLVTGAADDDPSGIATYSQIGAQFGYDLAWTMLFSFPLMAVIQAVSARIGCVTGYGIAQNLRRHYSPWLLRAVVLLLVVANVINLGADLGAMGAALGLLIGGPEHLYTVLFGVGCILLETLISYARYAAVLKWATLSLFANTWPSSLPRTFPGDRLSTAPSCPISCSTLLMPWPWSPSLARRSAPICSSGKLGRRWRNCIDATSRRFA